jgi:hypothetical protein
MLRLAIIGTAGRSNAPQNKMTRALYRAMIDRAIQVIKSIPTPGIILVSGGAAWADHVAVELFIRANEHEDIRSRIEGLELHLPTEFMLETERYFETGARDWRMNPGHSANEYHERFSEKLGKANQSFHDLATALQSGAKVKIYDGFHQRNTYIATADRILAFSWGTHEPEDGGTKDTWTKAGRMKRPRVHVSLRDLASHLPPEPEPTTEPEVGPTTEPEVGPTTEPEVGPEAEPKLETTTDN